MDESIMILEEYYKKERDEIPINCDEYFDWFLAWIEKSIYILNVTSALCGHKEE